MTKNLKVFLAGMAIVAFVAACNDGDMKPVTSMFGPTMKAAFALDETDEPLTTAKIQGLLTDSPLSLTTDPINL